MCVCVLGASCRSLGVRHVSRHRLHVQRVIIQTTHSLPSPTLHPFLHCELDLSHICMYVNVCIYSYIYIIYISYHTITPYINAYMYVCIYMYTYIPISYHIIHVTPSFLPLRTRPQPGRMKLTLSLYLSLSLSLSHLLLAFAQSRVNSLYIDFRTLYAPPRLPPPSARECLFEDLDSCLHLHACRAARDACACSCAGFAFRIRGALM